MSSRRSTLRPPARTGWVMTVEMLRAAYVRDSAAVPRLARALGLRGDAPLPVIAAAANDATFGAAAQWLSTYRFRARIAEQGAA